MSQHISRRTLLKWGLLGGIAASGCSLKRMPTSFVCRHCGKVHQDLPLSFGPDSPIYYDDIPAPERLRRATLTSDQCVIDGEHYFVRGCLDVPVLGTGDVFTWFVWVSLSEKSFRRMNELWNTAGRESEPSYFGWLSTPVPGYPDTINLKTRVHTRPVGERPFIELEPTDHPLAVEQRSGISATQARQRAENLLHGSSTD